MRAFKSLRGVAVAGRAVAGTGTVEVIVMTPNGASGITAKSDFTFGSPTVTDLSPNTGPQGGGTPVTVTGSGFGLGSEATTFKFGNQLAIEVACSSTTTCTMLAPAAAKTGTVNVIVKVNGKERRDEFAGRPVYLYLIGCTGHQSC